MYIAPVQSPITSPSPLRVHRPARPSTLLSLQQWGRIAMQLGLSDREAQVVQGMFDGRSESELAVELGVSAHTVHAHVKRLYRKLSVSNQREMLVAVFAAYVGLFGNQGWQGMEGHGGVQRQMQRRS